MLTSSHIRPAGGETQKALKGVLQREVNGGHKVQMIYTSNEKFRIYITNPPAHLIGRLSIRTRSSLKAVCEGKRMIFSDNFLVI